VACVVGDGSALFGIQALWTAAQWQLPVTFIILNNGGYGALKSFGRMLGIAAAPGHDLDGLDFAALATGFGCPARRVTDAAHLESTLDAAFASHATSLVEVVMGDGGPELY
jgi:benzoylformate decarboxylase